MTENDLKARCLRSAGLASFVINLVLAATKLLFAHYSGSLAVMSDAVDSASDVVAALVFFVVSVVVAKGGDREHPWGHSRAETTASVALSFVILAAGLRCGVSAVQRIAGGAYGGTNADAACVAALISIALKAALYLIQRRYVNLSQSELIRANMQNTAGDIALSAAVLAGLAASKFFSLPVLDPVAALLVSVWIIRGAVGLFGKMNMELMDGSTDSSLYKKLFRAASSVPGVTRPHRARIRQLSGSFDIELDIEVDPNITLYKAHEISEQVEEAIRKEIPETYDVVIHVEPLGSDSHQRKEEYGLTPASLER